MKFEMIDYSADYYEKLLEEPIPDNRGGKFVQIRNKKTGKEYIVLSVKQISEFHADIVEKFCVAMGIRGRYDRHADKYMISGASWEVTGGGYWVINSIEKTLDLADKSVAYGRFDPHGLTANILSLKQMKGYTIRIDSHGNDNSPATQKLRAMLN